MNKLQQLIQELCPDGVEWKTLEEVAEIKRGRRLVKKQLEIRGKYAVYQNCMIPLGYHHESNVEANTTFIICAGSAGEIGYSDVAFWAADDVSFFVPDNELQSRFLYYFLLSKQYIISSQVRHSSVPRLSKTAFEKLLIPIPPLPIQTEIVRILDKFSTLTAELKAELQARKSQYEYYRNQLLDYPMEESDQPSLRSSRSATSIKNNDNLSQQTSEQNPPTDNSVSQQRGKVEWKTLGEIGEVRMCKRILKEQTSNAGDVPFYKIGTFGNKPNAYISRELFEEYKSKYSYPKIGEVLISASGTIGRSVIFDGKEAYFQDSNIVWIEHDESQVLNKYLFYVYQIVKWEISEGGTIQRLYNDNLKKTKIPIPYPNDKIKSLTEQARIVSILDKFDTLVNSISEGLPKEIELRQKQYEYYRDMLLTFPQKTA